MASPTLFEMVHQVLADSEAQLMKTAAAEGGADDFEDKKRKAEEEKEKLLEEKQAADSVLKVAAACEYLADHLLDVVDTRTPAEKLAEYVEIQKALLKSAEDSPMSPPLNDGAPVPGAPGTAMEAKPNETPGENPIKGGDTGEALPSLQTPMKQEPTEKVTPADPGTAAQTNKDMMMAEQPEDVLKQSAAKTASIPGVPKQFAKLLMSKLADDAGNPAQISAGTTPELQAVPGVPPTLMQGSETGEMTPRETAPTSDQGAGREYLATLESAINFTKQQAKAPQKKALGEILTEPALSSAHDNVLNQALDSTSEAGVKISAAREILKKLAAASPGARSELNRMFKAAEVGMPIPPPGENLDGAAEGLAAEEPVSDEALMAAAQGVTTDELAKAQVMLASQAAVASAPGVPAESAVPMNAGPSPEMGMPGEGMPMEGAPAEAPAEALAGPPAEAGPPPQEEKPAPPAEEKKPSPPPEKKPESKPEEKPAA